MRITDALRGEHAAFYAQFDHLEATLPQAGSAAEVRAAAVLLAAALASHAALEDRLLFDALEPQLGPIGPLAVMRAEHDEIERGLAELAETQGLENARTLALHVVHVARDHFAKEEQVLFPIAERTLDVGALTSLGAAWAEARKVKL